MSRASKSKFWRQNAARLTRDARSEDDAEQALKEIVAVQTKSAARRGDGATVLREKQTKRSR